MTEEVKTEDKPEVAQNQQQIVETPKEEVSPEIKSETNKENWRKFREDRERERVARQEAEKVAAQKQAEAEALKAAMESILNKPQPQHQDPQFHVESEEDIIEKKVQIALQRERERLKQEQVVEEKKNLPARLEEAYKDFNYVCSSENLDYFEYHYPEIAKPYRYMPDGFDKWSSIYKAVKRFVPQEGQIDQKRMQENASKPKSVAPSMIDTSPKTVGWKLTEERKRENWARMQKERKSF